MTELARLPKNQKDIVLRYLEQPPVKIATLARDLGLEVKKATLPPRISGQLQRSSSSPSGFRIRVNRHESPERQRFTIAHELAHFLLHKDQIGDGIEDSILYRSSLSDAREAEANRLAAQLLMPKRLIESSLRDMRGLPSKLITSRLSEAYEVSEAAMAIRLGLDR